MVRDVASFLSPTLACREAGQIRNLDYSDVAIKLGRKRESEIFEAGWSTSGENATSVQPDKNALEPNQEKLSTPATSTAALLSILIHDMVFRKSFRPVLTPPGLSGFHILGI
ncbi:hypothetical protein PMIN05_000891 [Paraphaeosphaeria minitans]